jgi:hypothetical protein
MSGKSMVVGLLSTAVAGAAIFAVVSGTSFASTEGAMIGAQVAAASVVGGYIAMYVGQNWNY